MEQYISTSTLNTGKGCKRSIQQVMRPPSLKPEVLRPTSDISRAKAKWPAGESSHQPHSAATGLQPPRYRPAVLHSCKRDHSLTQKETQPPPQTHPPMAGNHSRPNRRWKLGKKKSAAIICVWNGCSETSPQWFFSICCQAPLMQSRHSRTQSEC